MGAGFTPGPIPDFRSFNGRAAIMSQLYSPTEKLQVTSRRRFGPLAFSTGLIAAGTLTTITLGVVNMTDILQAGDGISIELAQFNWAPGAITPQAQLVNATFLIQFPGFAAAQIGQIIATTLTGGGNIVMISSPLLLSSIDINSLRTGGANLGPQPIPLAAQPGQLTINASFQNNSAGGITINGNTFFWYRLVRGLEEN
jgi:hypothetical protein